MGIWSDRPSPLKRGIALAPYTARLLLRIGQAAHLLRRHRKLPGLYQMWVVSGVGVEPLARPEGRHSSSTPTGAKESQSLELRRTPFPLTSMNRGAGRDDEGCRS